MVVLPARSTYVIQPQDRTVFRAVKRAFTRLERQLQRECRGKAASPASFVELWTNAFFEAVTQQNILSGFKSCGINPFDPAYTLQHLPSVGLKKRPSTSSTLDSRATPFSPASPVRGSTISKGSSTKSDAGVQCTSKEINHATRDDPWNLRFRGFVTSNTFIEAASQAQEMRSQNKNKNLDTGSLQCHHKCSHRSSTKTSFNKENVAASMQRRKSPEHFVLFSDDHEI